MKKKLERSLIKRALIFGVFLFLGMGINAQYSISGKITDDKGTDLIGATIAIQGTYQGTISNVAGFYKMDNVKKGDYVIVVSYLGYESVQKEISVNESLTLDFSLLPLSIIADEVIVASTRAGNRTPVAVTNVLKEDLAKQNTGMDIPYQLSLTPSLVESSEAGNGIGYSALRIRGTDASRINVTINGIPLNDSESQGVFWVNMPDFSSSVDNIQIQRGVGTSTNGAAAFGATINFQTEKTNKEPYAEVQSVAGSFNTFRNTFKAGTGIIDGKYSFDARISKLKSDGFVDRAFSDHESFFVSGTYLLKGGLIKANIMNGDQKTGISWWGNPLVDYDETPLPRTYNPAGEYTDENGNVKYYSNQTDNYNQTHYQLFFSQVLSPYININTAFHYTQGHGYYEQYKEGEDYAEYGIEYPVYNGVEVLESDLTRQKWLENDFYGFTSSLNYKKNKVDATIGGAWNRYKGDHFGNILWAQYGGVDNGYQWYFNDSEKTDYNIYTKVNYYLTNKLNVYGDLQYRHIDYKMDGIDDDRLDLIQKHEFDFFNPKLGLFYKPDSKQDIYASFSVAHREPTRTNFKDAKLDPSSYPVDETLYDYELGYNFTSTKAMFGVNLYYMYYRDQLVPTGEKNSVGYDIMTNVDESYRAGVELVWGVQLLKNLKWDANFTLSQNKIKNFVEYAVYYDEDWNEEYKAKELGSTDLSYSPNEVGSSIISWEAFKNFDISFVSKCVGSQYFDNTSSNDRKLDAYQVHNFKISYSFYPGLFKNCSIYAQINNVFDEKYENNAYGGNYYKEGVEETWKYYYPQAGTNFLCGINIKF